MQTRPPAVAGSFYPSDPATLRLTIERLLEGNGSRNTAAPKAIIAPHAGIHYSGPVAASAYRRLMPFRDRIRRVVLVGPSHRTPVSGLGTSTAAAFGTPLGAIPVDSASIQRAAALPQVEYADAAHRDEHSLEVQLPFLQVVLEEFQIVPFVVGTARTEEVADTLELLWGEEETVIVVSSDLSHFHDHASAMRIDRETASAIEACRIDELDGGKACGFRAVAGLLSAAVDHGLTVRNVDRRDSSQTPGDPSRVVGYGAFVAC